MIKESEKRGTTQKEKGKEGRNKTERKKDLKKQIMVEELKKLESNPYSDVEFPNT